MNLAGMAAGVLNVVYDAPLAVLESGSGAVYYYAAESSLDLIAATFPQIEAALAVCQLTTGSDCRAQVVAKAADLLKDIASDIGLDIVINMLISVVRTIPEELRAIVPVTLEAWHSVKELMTAPSLTTLKDAATKLVQWGRVTATSAALMIGTLLQKGLKDVAAALYGAATAAVTFGVFLAQGDLAEAGKALVATAQAVLAANPADLPFVGDALARAGSVLEGVADAVGLGGLVDVTEGVVSAVNDTIGAVEGVVSGTIGAVADILGF